MQRVYTCNVLHDMITLPITLQWVWGAILCMHMQLAVCTLCDTILHFDHVYPRLVAQQLTCLTFPMLD